MIHLLIFHNSHRACLLQITMSTFVFPEWNLRQPSLQAFSCSYRLWHTCPLGWFHSHPAHTVPLEHLWCWYQSLLSLVWQRSHSLDACNHMLRETTNHHRGREEDPQERTVPIAHRPVQSQIELLQYSRQLVFSSMVIRLMEGNKIIRLQTL